MKLTSSSWKENEILNQPMEKHIQHLKTSLTSWTTGKGYYSYAPKYVTSTLQLGVQLLRIYNPKHLTSPAITDPSQQTQEHDKIVQRSFLFNSDCPWEKTY